MPPKRRRVSDRPDREEERDRERQRRWFRDREMERRQRRAGGGAGVGEGVGTRPPIREGDLWEPTHGVIRPDTAERRRMRDNTTVTREMANRQRFIDSLDNNNDGNFPRYYERAHQRQYEENKDRNDRAAQQWNEEKTNLYHPPARPVTPARMGGPMQSPPIDPPSLFLGFGNTVAPLPNQVTDDEYDSEQSFTQEELLQEALDEGQHPATPWQDATQYQESSDEEEKTEGYQQEEKG